MGDSLGLKAGNRVVILLGNGISRLVDKIIGDFVGNSVRIFVGDALGAVLCKFVGTPCSTLLGANNVH